MFHIMSDLKKIFANYSVIRNATLDWFCAGGSHFRILADGFLSVHVGFYVRMECETCCMASSQFLSNFNTCMNACSASAYNCNEDIKLVQSDGFVSCTCIPSN
jgi:hypothetical protein